MPLTLEHSLTITTRTALDLANAASLDTPAATARWLRQNGVVPVVDIEAMSLRARDLATLQASVREAATAVTVGRAMPVDSVETLNDLSAAVTTIRRLDASGHPPRAVERAVASSPVTTLLGELARAAIELLGGPDRERMRRCPARGCGRLFLAERSTQRWCSNACGNRTRVARHHERVRASGRSGTSA